MRLSPLPFALCLMVLPIAQASAQSEKALSPDEVALFDRMRAAYYHPGKIGLKCDGALDFTDVLKTMGGETKTDGAKALQGLKLHVNASAGGATEITFTWPPSKAPAELRAQLEAGAKQLVGGFFSAYWPVVTGDIIPTAKNAPVVVGTVDGGFLVTERVGSTLTRLTVGSNAVIRRVVSSSTTGQDSTSILSFTAPANPVPGDLLRLSGLDLDQQLDPGGRTRLIMKWTDQDVDGVHVPGTINVNFQGVINLPVILSGCSVTK